MFEPLDEVRPFAFSPEGEVSGPVVFVGYGISAPELGWDDYAALGPKGAAGKIVLVFRHEYRYTEPVCDRTGGSR